MWARPSVSVGLHSFTATSKPPATDHRCPALISAHPRRSFRPPQSSSSSSSQRRSSQEEIGGVGHAVLNALQSSPTPPNLIPNSKALASATANNLSNRDRKQSNQEKQQRAHKEERGLSGSEVLLALQKARARRSQSLKPTAKTKKKEGSSFSGGIRGGGGTEASSDCSNVRPLNVKSDWGVRLEELEGRLQEFLNS